MIRTLPLLVLLAACARPATHPSPAPAPPVRDVHAPDRAGSASDSGSLIIEVDGVLYDDRSFQALGLTGAQIDSVRVCRDRCSGPNLRVFTNRPVKRPPR